MNELAPGLIVLVIAAAPVALLVLFLADGLGLEGAGRMRRLGLGRRGAPRAALPSLRHTRDPCAAPRAAGRCAARRRPERWSEGRGRRLPAGPSAVDRSLRYASRHRPRLARYHCGIVSGRNTVRAERSPWPGGDGVAKFVERGRQSPND